MSAQFMPSLRVYALMVACAPLLAGCGRYTITSDDIITRDGQKAVLAAAVFRDFGSSFHQNARGVEVRFTANGEVVAQAVTNAVGRATAEVTLGPDVEAVQASAHLKGESLHATGPVFRWSPKKTVIAIDIDETISATRYSDLFIAEIDGSKPIPGAREAAWALAKKYEILYVSARPQFLQEKTHQWLRHNGFPPGPYAGADRFAACLDQAGYKRRMLAEMKRRWPNLLIGIGDKREDDKACGPNNMLTFIVNPFPLGVFTHRCIMMKDWAGVQEFFATHDVRLADPVQLAGIIQKNGEELRPAFEEAPAGIAAREATDVAATSAHPATVVRSTSGGEPRF